MIGGRRGGAGPGRQEALPVERISSGALGLLELLHRQLSAGEGEGLAHPVHLALIEIQVVAFLLDAVHSGIERRSVVRPRVLVTAGKCSFSLRRALRA